MELDTRRLVVVLGPTGGGKSTTAVFLAKRFKGEIISCDSMQVYKGFDIGTDKPSREMREDVPHHLIDTVDASHQYTAADFVRDASRVIREITGRNRLPFVVGGTGLYLKSLLEGIFPGPGRNPALRRRLEKEGEEKGFEFLWKKLKKVDPTYAGKIGKNDTVRIIRALEVYQMTRKPFSEHFSNTKSQIEDFHILRIGLRLEREILAKQIDQRVDSMFERGIVEEVVSLLRQGVEEDSPPFRSLGYSQVLKFLKNKISLEEAVSTTKLETRQYAKRQMTWFKKMQGIHWFSPTDRPSLVSFLEVNLK